MSTTTMRWTSADLESLPDDGTRYEIIDGELHMSKQPHWYHQLTCKRVIGVLDDWNEERQLGEVNFAPGLIFAEDDDVAPDVVWISKERLATSLEEDGKLHRAPELVIEILSPGRANERRDREAKLQLYGRRGVDKYWIVNWMLRCIDVYRRDQTQLHYTATLFDQDVLESPLLPGFSCSVGALFKRFPRPE
jgi:Uma2 family endonuclease